MQGGEARATRIARVAVAPQFAVAEDVLPRRAQLVADLGEKIRVHARGPGGDSRFALTEALTLHEEKCGHHGAEHGAEEGGGAGAEGRVIAACLGKLEPAVGVNAGNLATVLPNIGRFAQPNLWFMA